MPRPVPFLPFQHLATERLRMRPYVPADVDTYLFIRSDPGMNRFIDPQLWITTPEAIQAKMDSLNSGSAAGTWISWALTLADDDTMIGSLGIWGFDWERGSAELAYATMPAHQGRGYMSEALRKVLELAFGDLGLFTVMAHTHFENEPSRHMLQRLGFACTGRLADEPVLEAWAKTRPDH